MTPRTDAETASRVRIAGFSITVHGTVVHADFAKKLETELTAAQEELTYLKGYVIPEKDKHGRYWHDLAQERAAKL